MKIKLIFFSILIVTISNCKRYREFENSKEIEPKKISISNIEVQKILDLKVNLKNYVENGLFSIAIPSHYYAEYAEYGEDSSGLTFGKLITTSKNQIYTIKLESSTLEDKLATESVTIIKEENPNLILLKDLKDEVKGEPNFPTPFLYEDENSIVYDDIKICTILYDVSIKSYLIYNAEISHFAEISTQDKFNLAIHLLKNGKNLLNTNHTNIPFATWSEYVANYPNAEINACKSLFATVTKEMKVFLSKNEQTNIAALKFNLYRSNNAMNFSYLQFLDAIKSNNVQNFNLPEEIQTDFENTFMNYDVDFKYKVQQIENIDYFTVDDDYDTESEKLICHLDYQNKDFYIISSKIDTINKNFYFTMFNYFAKYKTLEITRKK